ncbi:MAG: hypothetical protein MUF38_04280 [Anaerolineae bacterium]|nr:hypothetical protein [Anaerolineae bacterium]
MLEDTLAHYIGANKDQINRLTRMKQSQVYSDPTYQAWVQQMDAGALHETLAHARAAYEEHLPQFAAILSTRYGMSNTPMSSFTLGNWLVGFLQYPDSISNLSKMHQRIPQEAFREMLPEMIQMLDDLPTGREGWQRALALMALPLVAVRD